MIARIPSRFYRLLSALSVSSRGQSAPLWSSDLAERVSGIGRSVAMQVLQPIEAGTSAGKGTKHSPGSLLLAPRRVHSGISAVGARPCACSASLQEARNTAPCATASHVSNTRLIVEDQQAQQDVELKLWIGEGACVQPTCLCGGIQAPHPIRGRSDGPRRDQITAAVYRHLPSSISMPGG